MYIYICICITFFALTLCYTSFFFFLLYIVFIHVIVHIEHVRTEFPAKAFYFSSLLIMVEENDSPEPDSTMLT